MQYKGYAGRFELDDEAGVFHGRVVGTRDLVTFEATSADELRRAFHDSVDDYLAFCAARGEKPDKPFSGKFVVRVGPELHRKLSVAAEASDESLNAWVAARLEALLGADTVSPAKTVGKGRATKPAAKSARA